MAGTVAREIRQGPPSPPADRGWDGGGGGGSGEPRGAGRHAAFVALFVLLAATFMVFGAFVVAFVARRGISEDWTAMPKPPILWVNTAVLLASSGVLEVARRGLRAADRGRFNRWWTAGTALGALFLVGQAVAWEQLRYRGVFIATNPSHSFFYVLSAAHALHLLGGLAALMYVDLHALRLRLGPAKRTVIDVSATFWHFLDGLWVCLMASFYLWG